MGKNSKRLTFAIRNVLLIVYSLVSIYPMIWTVINSFKERWQFSVDNMGLPNRLAFENYANAIAASHMDVYVINSIIASAISMTLILTVSFVTGYLLSRYTFKANPVIYGMFLLGMLIPMHSLLIPLFIQFSRLGLIDNLFMLGVAYCATGLPVSVFLIAGYVKTIPRDMEEAAYIDGANLFQVMFRIIFPMTKPVISTVVIMAFLGAWNEFPFALILLSKQNLKTIPIGMANFSGEFSVEYTQLLAASIMATLPVLIVYAIFNKQIVAGMTAGAVKG